jgi:cholinesterase
MLARFLSFVQLASVAIALPTAAPSPWTVGQQVSTTSGTVKGHAAPWPANSEISEYLGIPFAQPPVGPLRFAAPKAFNSNQSFSADKFVRRALAPVLHLKSS